MRFDLQMIPITEKEPIINIGENITLECFQVCHCECSRGCKLIIRNKDKQFSIGYSGDHSVTDDFGKNIQHVDLLIHEATFIDEFEINDIREMGHSTFDEAIQFGKQFADYTILTHLSSRYKSCEYDTSEPKILVAFDQIGFDFEDINTFIPLVKKANLTTFASV